MEVMLEGDYWGKPFNFPKPEISIEPDFMQEREEFNRKNPDLPTYQELYLMTFELASKFGTPYYDNQLPAYRGAGKGISCYQCCAYQFSAVADKDSDFDKKLVFEDGRHFSMGSWQVVSVNCPRAAYNAEGDDARLFSELRKLMDVAVEIFKIKRRWMDLIRANSRMPFAMQRPKDPNTGERGALAVDLEGLVYTIGVVGVNEMVQHHTGKQLHESREAFRLAIRAMTEMELYGRELSRRNNMTIALARTPAETTGQRFAVADLLDRRYHDFAKAVIKGDLDEGLVQLGKSRDLPIYYTNGTHVAPGANVPLTKRMEVEHVFFPIVDGGNIFHIWLGEARPDPRGLMDMAMKLCRNTQIGYFAFTRDITVSLRQFHERKDGKKPVAQWTPTDFPVKA
jgi:ribonucleoside-triphosphate reductase